MKERPVRTEGEPHDRLTRIGGEALTAIENHPEYEKGTKAIVFINDKSRGGICTHGYDDDKDAVVDLIMHLKAMFEVMGKSLQIHPIPNEPMSS